MLAAIMGLLACALLLYLAVLMYRFPHLRRMAWRNIAAQKHTSLLTAIGLTVSTALISMTLIANASMNRSAELAVDRHFGNIAYDLPSTDQPSLGQSVIESGDIEKVKEGYADQGTQAGVLPIVSYVSAVKIKNAAGKTLLSAPNLFTIGVDPEEAARFDPSLLSVMVDGLAADELLLSETAAAELDARAGDTVHLLDNLNQEHEMKVKRVVREGGLSGYLGIGNAEGTVLVSLETARRLAAVEEGAYTNLLLTDDGPSGWKAVPVRSIVEKQQKDATQFVSVIFGMTSSNAVLIGIVLITNIFKMMAEERRQEMGILRAIGLGKSDLKALLVTEGMLYGALSGLIGVAIGAGLAGLLIRVIGRMADGIFLDDGTGGGFHIVPGALVTGFSIGLSIVFLCVWLIARKSVRLSIVQALKSQGLEGGTRKKSSFVGLWTTVLAGILTVTLIAVTAVPDIRRSWLTEDSIALVLAATLLAVPMIVLPLVRGLRLVCDAMLFVVRRSASLSLMLRLAFRNMGSNRMRTGLILLMFAAVSCFISFPQIYHEAMNELMKRSDPRTAVGGYDLLARVPRIVATEELEPHLREAGLSEDRDGFRVTAVQQVLWSVAEGEWGTYFWKVNGIDRAFAESNAIPLIRRDDAFADDREAWREIAEGDGSMIIAEDAFYYTGGIFKLGDSFEFQMGGRKVSKRIIGVAKTTGFHPEAFGFWVNRSILPSLVKGNNEIHTSVFVQMAHPDKSLEKAIEKVLTLQNISPVTNIADSENNYYRTMMGIIRLFQSFNQMALLIGMTGLIVVMHRLIRQRRQQLGMLRAVGVSRGKLYGIVLLEGAFIGMLGIALGFAVGTYMSYVAFDTLLSKELGRPLDIPFGKLALYLAAAILVSVALACLPARKTLRIAPSEAAKYAG